jgi:hypothetical protein
MKDIINITNREEIVERLAELLMQFDKDQNSYQTDVYMYIDEETGAATLDTFVNVGGNSWLDDNHTTIYTDKEHFDSMYDYYCNNGDFADALDMEHTELQRETAKHLADSGEIDADEAEDYEPDWHEIKEYIETREDYVEKLTECYYDSIEEMRSDYINSAEEIVRCAEERATEDEEYRKYIV